MAKHVKEDRAIPALVAARPGDHEFHVPSSLDVDNYTCFGVTGKGSQPLCLKVILGSGKAALVHYGRMSSPINLDGPGRIIVGLANGRLEIQGSNMTPLLDYLGEQRLAWIKCVDGEGETDSIMMGKGEPCIKEIKFGPAKPGETA